MLKRLILWLGICLAAGPAAAFDSDANGAQSLWSALKSGGYVILIHHAVTEPGIGDPPNFTIGQCGTQRNLSTEGRADARRIGDAYRRCVSPPSHSGSAGMVEPLVPLP